MVYTTAPGMILTLGGYYVFGRSFAAGIHNLAGVEIISDALLDAFKIDLLTFVPAALLIALSMKKVAAIPGLALGIAAAAITAAVAQRIGASSLGQPDAWHNHPGPDFGSWGNRVCSLRDIELDNADYSRTVLQLLAFSSFALQQENENPVTPEESLR